MARAVEFRTIIDDSIDTPVGYDKKKLWDAIILLVKLTEYSHKSITREEINAFQPDWVTPEKVREAFHGFQSKKSPETDGLKPIILKHLPTDRHKLYHLTLQSAFITRIYTYKVERIFIPKPGKPSYKIAKTGDQYPSQTTY